MSWRSARPRTGRTLIARAARTSGRREPELRKVRHLHPWWQLGRQTQATVTAGQRPGESWRQCRRRCTARAAAGPATLPLLAFLHGLRCAPRAHARKATHPGHLLHHLASLEEAVDQAVHLGDSDTGAFRDAHPARAVDDLRVFA